MKSRPTVALLLTCAVIALGLVFATNGTLAAWTTATVNNTTNTTRTQGAVVLREVSGATCRSDEQPSNVSSCTTINKYGGVNTPLGPGGSAQVDVVFTNMGTANATSFTMAPGACTSTPPAGATSPTNLCTAANELTVNVRCSPGATFDAATAWGDLVYPAAAPPTTNKTHTATGAELNAGSSWTCRFVVALNANASLNSQSITVSQPITWNLNR